MTELHTATSGALVREIVKDVLAEFDVWRELAPSQAAGLNPTDSAAAAEAALYDVRMNLDDHLCIRLASTLATFGITPDGAGGTEPEAGT